MMDYQVKWIGQTLNETPKEIFFVGGTRLTIASGATLRVEGSAVALESSTGASREWGIVCLVKNVAGTVSFVGDPFVTDVMGDSSTTAWSLAISVDNVNKALAVTVTGETGKTIDWNTYADYALIGTGAPVVQSITAIPQAIITLNELKNFLAISLTDTTLDNFLQTWINYESLRIEGPDGINNKVVAQTISGELGNGNGRSKYRPSFYPVIDLGGVGASDAEKLASMQYDLDGTWTNVESDINNIYINSPVTGFVNENNSYNIELASNVFPLGTRNIKLTYRAGYSTVPSDLVLVCLERCAELYQNSYKGGKRFGLESVSKNEGGGSNSTRYKDFVEKHRKMMKPYKRTLI